MRWGTAAALATALALAVSLTAGDAADAAKGQATASKKAAKAKKKKGSNKPRTFQNAIPTLIPDDPGGPGAFPGQLDSWIRIGKRMKGKAVADVNVSVRISHPDSNDISLFLISPQGATVWLAADSQGPGPDEGYGAGEASCRSQMTTFDDETFNFKSSENEVDEPGEIISPWAAPVQPFGFPLSTMDGNKARGRWTLRILDFSPGDIGTLHCWKLRIKPR
jgi:subtilisin-like proprotein convertase family protein